MSDADLGSYRPYPEYKDSGVEWLGEIPEHWEAKRLRYVADSRPSKTELRGLSPQLEVSFVPMEAIGEYGGLQLDQTKPLDTVAGGYTFFRNDDVVIAKITPCFENGKGALARNLLNGIALGTTELHVLEPHQQLYSKFLFYVSMSDHFRKMGTAEMYGAGGQKRVPESYIRNFSHTLPPLPEQRAIAAFLDRETTRIDELITHKQRLIELLQEKRSALITQAVTQGLDPGVEMKESGVEWLGRVPAGWGFDRVKHLSSFITSGSRGWAEYYCDDGALFIRVGNLSGNKGIDLDFSDIQHVDPPTNSEGQRTRVFRKDVLLAITGATIGSVAVVRQHLGEAYVNQHVALIRPVLSKTIPTWLGYSLYSSGGQAQVDVLLTGGTKQGLGLDDIREFIVALPPIDEQVKIVKIVESASEKMDALINQVKQAINHLNEYRTALISAAVTGKVDVRAPHPGPPQPGEGEIPADQGGNPLPSQGRVATEGRREGSRLTRHDWQPPPALWAKLKPLAREMRKQPTPAEAKLWQRLRRKQVRGVKFRRQFAIGRFITDFCSPAVRLIIEVDGSIHDQQQEYDAIRTEYLEAAGFEVVRFRNEDVLGNLQGVMEMIDAVVARKNTTPPQPSPGRGGGRPKVGGGVYAR